MAKSHRNIKHLESLIIGAINFGHFEDFKIYLSRFPNEDKYHNTRRRRYLLFSIKKMNINIAEHLLNLEDKEILKDTSIINRCLSECLIGEFDSIYAFLISLGFNITESHKKFLMKRLVDPSKIETNPERIDFTVKYLQSGFFKFSDFMEIFKEIQSSKAANSKYHSLIKYVNRELNLIQLLS